MLSPIQQTTAITLTVTVCIIISVSPLSPLLITELSFFTKLGAGWLHMNFPHLSFDLKGMCFCMK